MNKTENQNNDRNRRNTKHSVCLGKCYFELLNLESHSYFYLSVVYKQNSDQKENEKGKKNLQDSFS